MKTSRGAHAVRWIERYCVVPGGPERGQHVRLTQEQAQAVREIYDNPTGSEAVTATGPLAAYLALLHTCGPEALQREFQPKVEADIFTVWNATGPDLRAVLKRDGERIVCPELGTKYPAAA